MATRPTSSRSRSPPSAAARAQLPSVHGELALSALPDAAARGGALLGLPALQHQLWYVRPFPPGDRGPPRRHLWPRFAADGAARRRAARLLAPDPGRCRTIGNRGADPDHRPGGAAVPGARHALEQAGRLNIRSMRRTGRGAPGRRQSDGIGDGLGLGGGGAVLSRIVDPGATLAPAGGFCGATTMYDSARGVPPCHWITRPWAVAWALASATVRPTYFRTATRAGVGVGVGAGVGVGVGVGVGDGLGTGVGGGD